MAEIIQFKKPRPSEKHRGNTLCKRGFHKWVEDKSTHFDVKQGKLVTRYRCSRCGITRVRST